MSTRIFSSSGAAQTQLAVRSPIANLRPAAKQKAPFSGFALRKISNNDQQTAPEPLVAHRSFLLGLAIACSLWDSLQRFRGLPPHLIQRTSITTCFPLPSLGRPSGHREALPLLCNFSRVSQSTFICKWLTFKLVVHLQLVASATS